MVLTCMCNKNIYYCSTVCGQMGRSTVPVALIECYSWNALWMSCEYAFLQTTPGNYLECGQVLAAKMCRLWGLELWRVKYALEAGFEKVKVMHDCVISTQFLEYFFYLRAILKRNRSHQQQELPFLIYLHMYVAHSRHTIMDATE